NGQRHSFPARRRDASRSHHRSPDSNTVPEEPRRNGAAPVSRINDMPVSRYPGWESFKITPNARDCPVAFCADLSPASVLSACKRGIFPFPAPDEHLRDINEFQYEDRVSDGAIGLVGSTDDDPYWVAWWSPDPRPVIKVAKLHLGRNVRKQLRRGQTRTTANDSFQRVAEECRAGREPRWLTDTLLESMVTLHSEG